MLNAKDYESLKHQCLAKRKLFEDPAFPATNRLLVSVSFTDSYGAGSKKRDRFGKEILSFQRSSFFRKVAIYWLNL